MKLYIGIDSGTQSTKGIALDLDSGKVVADARAPHTLIGGLPEGHMEQHPAEWSSALESVLEGILSKVERTAVRGIGVSGQQHGFVPLDASNNVIRPAKLWCDTSTAVECEILTKKLGGAKSVIRLTGLPFLPGYTAPKILWMKRHEPANFKKLAHVLLPHDFLNLHLTGAHFMEYGDASGTALMDVRKRGWSTPVLNAIDRKLPSCLPPLSPSHEAAGVVRPYLAQKLGLPADVVVSAGGGDNMMGAIGTGNVKPGVVSASLGTSGTIFALCKKPVVDPRGEIAAFCSSTGGWLPLLCTMNVTLVTEHFAALFGMNHAAMNDAVSSIHAGSDGLMFLPYMDGERTPNLPRGKGVLFGATRSNSSSAHIMRAAMEGATLGMNYGLRRMSVLGVKPKEIRVTGGGARSAVWRQLMADIFGVPVVKMVQDEGAALGAAIQAVWCDGLRRGEKPSLDELCARHVEIDEGSRRTPDPNRKRAYRAVQERFDSLTAAMKPFFA